MLRRDLVEWLTPEQRVAASQIATYNLHSIFKKNDWAWFNRLLCLYYCTADVEVPAKWLPVILRDLNRVAATFGASVPSIEEQVQAQQGRRMSKQGKTTQ